MKQENLEARVGIEPTHKGFADLSLTTWVPRPEQEILRQREPPTSAIALLCRPVRGVPYMPGVSDVGVPGAGDGT